MKRWIGRLMLLVGSPLAAYGLLAIGAEWRESLWGRLIQVAGGFVALVWLVASFLIVGAIFSGGSGYRAANVTAPPPVADTTIRRTNKPPEETEA